jgi:hypothetical protein
MGRTYDFVVLPALTIAVFPFATFIGGITMTIAEFASFLFQEL